MTALYALPNQIDTEYPCAAAPEVFFDNLDPVSVMQAKALCGRCPVATACLTGAIERREPHGVWGGALLEYGQVVAYKRGPGRPPAHMRRAG